MKYWFHWFLQLSRLYTEIISKYTCVTYSFDIYLLYQNETTNIINSYILLL